MLDKPAGWTSHQVVGRVRRLAGTRKVGHAGTLDPMATGVLLVGIGRGTRLLGRLTLTAKTYTATVRLGISTNTDDADGEVTARPGARVDPADLEAALSALRGPIMQVPASVSAIRVGGVRSYVRARAGEEVALAARPVTVQRFEALSRRDQVVDGIPVVDLEVLVACSAGTYVRALARDLGAALGTAGHLTALRRTQVGPYTEAEAQTLDQAAADGLRWLTLGEAAARCFPTLALAGEQAAHVRHGRRLPGLDLPGDPTALLDADGQLLALYRPSAAGAVPETVFVAA